MKNSRDLSGGPRATSAGLIIFCAFEIICRTSTSTILKFWVSWSLVIFLKKGTKWILALNVRFLFSNKHIYLSIYIRGSVATVTLLIDNAGQFNIWTLGGSVDATTRQHPAVELAVLYPIWSFFLKLDIKINSIPLSCLSESELAAVFRSMNVLMLCFKLRYKEKNGVQRPNYVFIYFFVSLPY